nr:PREDICTED: EF-hand calcium-binding domain-containing protein 6-like isoform X1 [Lepisosteus oculatus]
MSATEISARLPAIQHPLSRLGDPDSISLRGVAADSARAPRETAGEGERAEALSRSQSRSLRPRLEKGPRPERDSPFPLHQIPEGVEVAAAPAPERPRLPVFGLRAEIGGRAESRGSACSSRASTASRPGTQLQAEVDELEHLLREKLRAGGYFTMRQLFKNNDPEGKGQVNRDVLLMIITKFLGRFISTKQYQQLLLRLQLSQKAIVRFEELLGAVREPAADGAPAWLGPLRRPGDGGPLTAAQVQAQLRGKAGQRFADMAEQLVLKSPDGPGRIVAPKLRHLLEEMGLHMEDEEFEKLWKSRYDQDGTGAIRVGALLKRLGIDFGKDPLENVGRQSADSVSMEDSQKQSRMLSKAEEERKASITIEQWLKDKFREGFQRMKSEFERCSPGKENKVPLDEFLRVLAKFDLHLKKEHLSLFLARCGLEGSKAGIDYIKFLGRFQDRSEEGVTHKLLSNPQHKFNREENISLASTVTAIEAKLAHLFQSDFLALLDTFRKIDKFDRRIISQQEFRAAIESRFSMEIDDDEFEQLLDRLPLDEEGNVQYLQFMAAFDSRKGAPSLFEASSEAACESVEGVPKEASGLRSLQEGKAGQESGRSAGQLFRMIKVLLNKQYQTVEKAFEQLDEKNTKRLTQETMYQLLKRFDINPEVSRGEIRKLWGTLITNQDKTLDFFEFVRHFGYSPKSACFPNAKISPPKKGDDNFRLRSKKLNCASDILVDSVRAKVEFLFGDLQKEFEDLDPYQTGFVSKEEFKDILTELCAHLNEYECDILEKKFEIHGDGRVSYVEFLKPFALQRQMQRHGASNMAAVLHHIPRHEAEIPENKATGLGTLTSRLRNKLQGESGSLRRAFKKLDSGGSGFLSLAEFRSVLKLCNLVLDEEEVYHILAKFDENMSGQIDYKRFLKETAKKQATKTENV